METPSGQWGLARGEEGPALLRREGREGAAGAPRAAVPGPRRTGSPGTPTPLQADGHPVFGWKLEARGLRASAESRAS